MIHFELIWEGPDGRVVPMTRDNDEEKITALCEQMNAAAADGVGYYVVVVQMTTQPLNVIRQLEPAQL